MTSRRHRIGPDARSGGESWVSRPFEPLRQRRWTDSVPPAVGRKGHACFVIAPRRSIPILLRRDASHARPFRPIVRSLVFRQSLIAIAAVGIGQICAGDVEAVQLVDTILL